MLQKLASVWKTQLWNILNDARRWATKTKTLRPRQPSRTTELIVSVELGDASFHLYKQLDTCVFTSLSKNAAGNVLGRVCLSVCPVLFVL